MILFNPKISNNKISSRQSNLFTYHFWLKRCIWTYFLLLLFEGTLRKWFLPGLATPLLIVRDPIAFAVILVAWQKGIFRFNIFCQYIIGITLISFVMTMLVGHQNIFVAIYGARIMLIHFPMMFVIGKIFNREDVLQIGKVLLWVTIPMILLITLQFYSPQSAWVNRGVGGDMKGAGFGGAMGYFRPPGTFSFTNGNSFFWGLVAPFVFYFWLGDKSIQKFLLLIATAALFMAIPISISRTLLFEVSLTILFTGIGLFFKPRYMKSFLIAFVVSALALTILSKSPMIQTGMEVFESRFTSASEQEGGLEGTLIDRFLGGMINAIFESDDLPVFGHGIGMGTNVGAMMISGKRTFLIAEGEWGRLIGEIGILLGLCVIVIRFTVSYQLIIKAFRKMQKGDLLPWLLMSFGFVNILQGQWAQPTALGFCTLIGGLILASLKKEIPSNVKLHLLLESKIPKQKENIKS